MPNNLFRYTTKVTHNTGAKLGVWQSRIYNPAKIKRIGFWMETSGPDLGGALAAQCYSINPFLADISRTNPRPISTWTSRYLASGGAVEPYIWNPFDPSKPEYFQSGASWPPYENHQFIYKNWREYFLSQLPLVIDYLAPDWLTFNAPDTAADMPYILFHAPHGKVNEPWAVGMDFYNSCWAYEMGFDYLVDGFYEYCRYLHSMGVTVGIHNGHPTQNDAFTKRPLRDYQDVMQRLEYGRVHTTLDACVIKPVTGRDGICAAELYANGDGVGIEGIPDSRLPNEFAWLTKPYDFVVLSNAFFPRVHPDYQVAPHIGAFPVLGTQQFSDTYGANRYIYWQMYETEFGLTYPEFTGSDAAKDTYLAAFAVGTKRLLTLWPKSICLLPWNVLSLAASRRFPAVNFLP